MKFSYASKKQIGVKIYVSIYSIHTYKNYSFTNIVHKMKLKRVSLILSPNVSLIVKKRYALPKDLKDLNTFIRRNIK